jgi:uncharacterized protein
VRLLLAVLIAVPFRYHRGELEMQNRAGVTTKAARMVASVRDELPPAAVAFLDALEFLVVGSADGKRQPWVRLVVGGAGFVQAIDARGMVVRTATPQAAGRPPLLAGSPVGLLGIDFTTRRRMRVNGSVLWAEETGFAVQVREAYSNCKKYIHARERGEHLTNPTPQECSGTVLTDKQRRWVSSSDTFFIVTMDDGGSVDASHRGGAEGFVEVADGTHVAWDDHPGNAMFNTLGNLEVSPSAALLFIDFETGGTLHLAGTARTRWAHPSAPDATGRRTELEIGAIHETSGLLAHRWPLVEPSGSPEAHRSIDSDRAHSVNVLATKQDENIS